MILMPILLVAPIPLIQIFPASVIAIIIALVHFENDGLLLASRCLGHVRGGLRGDLGNNVSRRLDQPNVLSM